MIKDLGDFSTSFVRYLSRIESMPVLSDHASMLHET